MTIKTYPPPYILYIFYTVDSNPLHVLLISTAILCVLCAGYSTVQKMQIERAGGLGREDRRENAKTKKSPPRRQDALSGTGARMFNPQASSTSRTVRTDVWTAASFVSRRRNVKVSSVPDGTSANSVGQSKRK